MRYILTSLLVTGVLALPARAQFAPQAGITGTDALHKSDPLIRSWATGCVAKPGLQHIADPASGYPVLGAASDATGAADGLLISLGDSGVAVLTFDYPIYNGSGADFAVFENGFANPANKEEAFLELAFVEVSSDGEHFFRFPAISNTPAAIQVKGSGDYMNARTLDNLAGKYIAQYGTPFDLEDLKDSAGLDINNITHVRIIDVVGDISGDHSSRDSKGNIINDPYPTAFPTGGFDLDAVAVINQKSTGISLAQNTPITIFPNPAAGRITIDWQQLPDQDHCIATLSDLSGRRLISVNLSTTASMDLAPLQPGLYYLSISNPSGTLWSGKISKI